MSKESFEAFWRRLGAVSWGWKVGVGISLCAFVLIGGLFWWNFRQTLTPKDVLWQAVEPLATGNDVKAFELYVADSRQFYWEFSYEEDVWQEDVVDEMRFQRFRVDTQGQQVDRQIGNFIGGDGDMVISGSLSQSISDSWEAGSFSWQPAEIFAWEDFVKRSLWLKPEWWVDIVDLEAWEVQQLDDAWRFSIQSSIWAEGWWQQQRKILEQEFVRLASSSGVVLLGLELEDPWQIEIVLEVTLEDKTLQLVEVNLLKPAVVVYDVAYDVLPESEQQLEVRLHLLEWQVEQWLGQMLL